MKLLKWMKELKKLINRMTKLIWKRRNLVAKSYNKPKNFS